jgi:PAS domain S-box-containing protein
MALDYQTSLDCVIDRSPLTIAPSGLVLDAIALMNEAQDGRGESSSIVARAGCILAVEDRQLLGIFTERDVVRLIAAGRDLTGVKMAEVMTSQPITIKESEVYKISTALSLLHQHRISHLPVVDDRDLLIGILSETSLLQLLGAEATVDAMEKLPQPSQARLDELEQINQQLYNDIHSRQLVEDALRLSQERLQLALEGSGDGWWDWDISTGETYLSPSWLEMLGYAPEELSGSISTWEKLIHPEDKPWVMGTLNAHLKDRSLPYAFDYRMLTKSGEWKWIANFGKVVTYDRDGKPLRMAGTHRDISDRKQIEIQLREREEFASSIYYGTEQAIFIVDVDVMGEFRYAGFNPVSEQYAGVTNAQIQGKTPEEAFGNEVGNALRQNYALCLQTGASITYEEEIAFAERTIWTLTTLAPLQDARGQIYRIVGTAMDITERKHIEYELRESEERLQALLNNSTSVIYMKDLQSRYILINHRYAELFHIDQATAKGKTDYDFFPPDIATAFQANDRAVIESGTAIEWEELAPLEDGLHTYLSVKFPLVDAMGQIYAVCGISTDISDRKRQEEILRNIALGVSSNAGESFFQALAEYATKALGVAYAFISELIPPENDSVRVIGGYGDGQRLDNFEYDLIYTPCQHVLVKQPRTYICQVQAEFPKNKFLQDIGAESYMGVPLINSNGQVLGLICVISHEPLQRIELMLEVLKIFAACASVELERQYAEKELQRQKQELTRSNDELEQFAYVASHDLQEPLRMVVSYLQLLERRYKSNLDASADEFIAYAVDGASRMQTLINDLLEYSRVNTRGQDFTEVDCSEVLECALGNLKMAIAESNAVITCDRLPEVVADSSQLAQLLQNLIGNAIKFRGKLAPQIHIGAEHQVDHWLFSVCDNGIGIEPQYSDRIFAVFQRLHSRVKYKGTGIGLAICKKIVERRGGSIWVESKLDRGSTFYFTIPDRIEV